MAVNLCVSVSGYDVYSINYVMFIGNYTIYNSYGVCCSNNVLCATDKSARQLYLPKGTTLSHCDVCPECCSSNGSSQSVVGSVTMGTSLLGVLLTLCIAALSSCLLSF